MADETTGAVGPGRGGRMSRRRKRDAVLRLLRGEDLETVSRALGVTAATWRTKVPARNMASATSTSIGCPVAWSIKYSYTPCLSVRGSPGLNLTTVRAARWTGLGALWLPSSAGRETMILLRGPSLS